MPAFGQSVLNIVHRSANQLSIRIGFAKLDCQGNFRKFGTHTEQGRNPHPEDCARTTDGKRAGNSGNISGADGGSQSGADRLKGSNGAVRSILFAEHSSDGRPDGIWKLSNLEKSGSDT